VCFDALNNGIITEGDFKHKFPAFTDVVGLNWDKVCARIKEDLVDYKISMKLMLEYGDGILQLIDRFRTEILEKQVTFFILFFFKARN